MNALKGFRAQSPTTSLWKISPTGKIKFFSNLNLIVFLLILRTLAAYQHKASGVTIMKQKTILPRYAEVLQYDHNEDENHQNHTNFKALMGSKTGWTATGCTGTAAWRIGDSGEMLVVMWSVPFDQNWCVHEQF